MYRTAFRLNFFLVCLASMIFSNTGREIVTTAEDRMIQEMWDEIENSPSSGREVRYECPSPYKLIAGSCLHSPTTDMTTNCDWESSRQHCLSLDGDLASFGNLKELLLIIGHMRATKSHNRWVGARRANSSDSFRWLDGSYVPNINSSLWTYVPIEDFDCLSFEGSRSSPKLKNYECNTKTHRCSMWCQLR